MELVLVMTLVLSPKLIVRKSPMEGTPPTDLGPICQEVALSLQPNPTNKLIESRILMKTNIQYLRNCKKYLTQLRSKFLMHRLMLLTGKTYPNFMRNDF